MLPSDHMLYGGIISFIIYFIFPEIGFINLLILLFSTFLLDIDHYFQYVYSKREWSISKAMVHSMDVGNIAKKNKKIKEPLMIFHTAEFLILLFALSYLINFFFYIFLGQLIHLLIDIYSSYRLGILHVRDFSIIRYIIRNQSRT